MGRAARRRTAVWPPAGIETFDPWHLPLINTLILLCSGAAATWAHHALVHENNRKDMQRPDPRRSCWALLFTVFQAYEYSHAAFGFSGNIYGANFFMATGFHGAHVIIGTIFLFVCLLRVMAGHFTPDKHVGFEAAAWYWHFVDVVWLFLFAASTSGAAEPRRRALPVHPRRGIYGTRRRRRGPPAPFTFRRSAMTCGADLSRSFSASAARRS